LTGASARTSIGRVRKWFVLFAASIVAVAACGARTGLRVDELRADAGVELDAGPDVTDVFDAPEEPDAVDPFPDVGVVDCQDAGITYVYLISSENELLRFYPPDLSVVSIGTIDCPTTSPSQPFSMAVDRQGVAYVVFMNGELFRVSTLTASCKATSFVPNLKGFSTTFGMGFSANKDDPGETLYVAGSNVGADGGFVRTLATIDPSTFNLFFVHDLDKDIGAPELTGTGDSRLFAYAPGNINGPDSQVAELDKATATVLSDVFLDLNQPAISSYAFAFWGGDFYIFGSEQQGTSIVHRYTPGGSLAPPAVAQIGFTIVGAGVSTCAPSE
jgi:hypothetical protein